jgi:trans-aconitate methyltransferase
MYDELAEWWPLISAPEDYAEEAAFFRGVIDTACAGPVREVLELGSGGGNNASHLKKHWRMTLVDLSPGMLAVSRKLNPECEHVEGDMRTVRLGREFDAVFVHDAVTYLTNEADVRAAIETAFVHCRAGGAAIFVPDATRESFRPYTDHGGHDGAGRSLRYLEWCRDPDPADTEDTTDYVFLLDDGDSIRVVHDRHTGGLFSREDWLRWLRDAGFEASAVPFHHSEFEADEWIEVFVGKRPAWPGGTLRAP